MSVLMRDWFRLEGVGFNLSDFEPFGSPSSTVIVVKETGSRTILHHNPGLPELSPRHFEEKILPKLDEFDWIHFEGRNVANVLEILDALTELDHKPTVSIELEKAREEMLKLAPFADVLFISKEFAEFQSCADMENSVVHFRSLLKNPNAIVVCAWGDKGAAASSLEGVFTSRAFPPDELVETLGAGDTFNAAFIFAMREKHSIQKCLEFACRVAGAKCGQVERKGLRKLVPTLQ